MKISVNVFEARGLIEKEISDAVFVKLRVGKNIRNTKAVKGKTDLVWNEEFAFRVSESAEELVVNVMVADDEAAGEVKVPLWMASESEHHSLPPTWFPLRKHSTAYKMHNCGEILLSFSLLGGKSNSTSVPHPSASSSDLTSEGIFSDSSSTSSFENAETDDKISVQEEKNLIKNLTDRLVGRLLSRKRGGSVTNNSETSASDQSDHESYLKDASVVSDWEEALSSVQTNVHECKVPDELKGGILLDKHYEISTRNLNAILFAPNSQFMKELADLEGTTNIAEGPWILKSEEDRYLQRTLTYVKAGTKLMKPVIAKEVQTYCYVEGNSFAVVKSVSTPNVPYGNCFEVVLLYTITPGKQAAAGEETAHLVISYELKFYQSTIMRSMIECGAEKGLRESFNQFAALLALKFTEVDSESSDEKNKILEAVNRKRKSNLDTALLYFWNFTMISTLFLGVFIMLHIILSVPSVMQGLEFGILDFPDSFGEVASAALFVLQAERVYTMILWFVRARLLKDCDHGKRKSGDGWSLIVAVIEGRNIYSPSLTSLSDPFVVLECNGETLTSSVQLQSHDPQWNEILEFDAMEEPPSLLDVQVLDFRQSFEKSFPLGHAEINLLKCAANDLADIRIPLQGKFAQTSKPELHLKIFLDNSKGDQITKEYIGRMDKELKEKVSHQNPRRNSKFQRLFRLPPEEFLVNEFSCCLKRKLLLQGRIFVSLRVFGFYSNLFGHKTKFFFLWEELYDIQVIPPCLASVGSPSLVVILDDRRGHDARRYAKCQDEEGRLRFQFQSFLSFSDASRTIKTLWIAKTFNPKQNLLDRNSEEEYDETSMKDKGDEGFSDAKEVDMCKVHSASIPLNINTIMEVFNGGELEREIMTNAGCLNYTFTHWKHVHLNTYERQISYNLILRESQFGGSVTSTQRKSSLVDLTGVVVNEIAIMRDVPSVDHFKVRYLIEESKCMPEVCNCSVFVGIAWMKCTDAKEATARDILQHWSHQLEKTLNAVERKLIPKKSANSS